MTTKKMALMPHINDVIISHRPEIDQSIGRKPTMKTVNEPEQ